MAEIVIGKRVILESISIGGKPFIRFDFKGHLDLNSANDAIASWKKLATDNQKLDIIYNCLEMTGFDTEARKIWQTTMGQLKASTGRIWIISNNAFILGAAKTMGVLSGYDIKVAKSVEGIKVG